MEEFETIDIENNYCRFQYHIEFGDELEPDNVHFKVFLIPQNSTRWFLYTFKILDEYTAKGETMTNHGYSEFSKKGIPEKIIEIAAETLNRKIISSPVTPEAGNYLVETSLKVWERVVEKNKNATFNETEGYFEFNLAHN
jgi:hypothetical protein